MIYITSDLHLGHDRDFIYSPRGFSNIKEHDETIIKNWNEIVKNEDIVYILGDIMLNDNKKGLAYLKSLKGKKKFIRGNHDNDERWELIRQVGEIIGYATIIEYNGDHFYLSHYPTITTPKDVIKSHSLYCLYGHTHSKEKFYDDNPNIYNISVDANDLKPISIEDIKKNIENKKKSIKK